jgi:hypothetical protein
LSKAKTEVCKSASGRIERIVIFYEDGNFKEYLP